MRLRDTAAMLRPFVLFLTLCTGFTGLAYEVTWQKYLAILLGAHSEATASVLGLFLGGLSLGYWLFGALTRALVERGRHSGRPAPLLLLYGAVEASIGAYCLLFPSLFPLVRQASLWLPTGAGGLAFAVDLALAALLILPGATLMGATIPVLTQALARNLGDATRVHAQIYAWNTVGAFAGALATGFFLIERLGLDGVQHAMGFVNLAAGATIALIGLRRRELAALDPSHAPPLAGGVFAVYGTAALFVGFAMMVLQTIVIRIGALSFGSSEYTFTMVVAVFVLCIALGSFEVSGRTRIGPRALAVSLWLLALLFAGLYLLLETVPYWAHVLRVLFRDMDAAFYPYYVSAFVFLLLGLAPAVALAGAILPLLFHTLRHEVGDLGSQAGRLYSVNTLGSLLGALVGGYLLLIWLDLHQVYRIAVAALALAATVVTLHQFPKIRLAGAGLLILAAIGGIASLPAWRSEYLSAGAFRVRQPSQWSFAGPSALLARSDWRMSFYDDDPNSSVAVQDIGREDEFTRSIVVNGKSDGNSAGDYTTTALLALVPALFAERLDHAFVIGFGTGVTAGVLTELEETQSVTVAEISSGVIAAAPLFDFANNGASKHPKVRIVHSDAYRALLRGGQHYDVIVSEPSNPWVTGIEQLYSREFLSEARDRLTPGGVYCQWFHVYEMNDEVIRLALKTYAAVFDHVAVWSANQSDLILLGFRDTRYATDLARLEQRFARADFSAVARRIGIGDFATLLAHETLPLDVLAAVDLPGPTHSLYRPLLSFEAGRAFFVGARGDLPFTGYGRAAQVGAEQSLLARYLASLDGERREQERAAVTSYACDNQLPGCGALAAAWAHEDGRSAAFQALAARLRGRDGPLFLRRLRVLRDGLSGQADRRVRPAAAMAITELYMQQYAHSAPLQPATLLKIWQRCGLNEAGIERCSPGLRAAERLMIGDRPPDPGDWLTPRRDAVSSAHHAPAPDAPPDEAAHEADADAEL
jgi:spermidine synthase